MTRRSVRGASAPLTVRVLLIEDNKPDAVLLQEALNSSTTTRFEVRWMEDLSAGLEAALSEKPDILVTDLMLPDSEGLDTFRSAKAAIPDIPIVVLSGSGDEATALAAVQEGAIDYLMKGKLNSEMFPLMIRSALEHHRGTEELRQRERNLLAEQVLAEAELRRLVSNLQSNEEERRRLLERLVAAQEDERRHIAEAIHDDSIQAMTAAGMRLEIVQRALGQSEHREIVSRAYETIHRSIGRLRHLMFELLPPSLSRQGLADAIDLYLVQCREEGGPAHSLVDRLETEPPEQSQIVLYRIAQEALNNVRKHAAARRVRVILENRDRGVAVRIEDDGRGFEPVEKEERPGHLGLSAMRERAEMAGGWFRLESSPGRGTTVEFWIPDAGKEAP